MLDEILQKYEITKDGKVINKKTGTVRVLSPNSKGYLRFHYKKKHYLVHRLVAELYLPNPDHKEQVNHIDGNKLNNSVDNLEWVSNQENRTHAVNNDLHLCGEKCPWAKLTEDDVRYIRKNLEIPNKILAEKFQVSTSCIQDVKTRKTWKKVE